MKNRKAGASLRSKCLAILHCLVFTLFAQPAYAKRPISKPPSIEDEILRPLGLENKPRGQMRDVWREAQDRALKQPPLTPENVEKYHAIDPSINIDAMTLRMCQLQSNQRLRMCRAIREAVELYRILYYTERILDERKNDPWESSWTVWVGAGAGAILGSALSPVGALVGGVTSGMMMHKSRKGTFNASIESARKRRKEVSRTLQFLVQNGVYSEILCLSYNGVVKISEKGEMICYRKNTDSSKSANQFNLASLADAHGKVCQELYGKKAAPARYVLGNKIVCSVNNKYEVVKDYTLTDLINGCKMTGKKVGEAATKVCTDFIAGMKKPKTEIHALSNSTGQKADATSPKGTSTSRGQNIADQVAKIMGTDPAQKSQTGNPLFPEIIGTNPTQKSQTDNPLSPDRTTKSMKNLKHQMILEAIKQEREANKMRAENFEKLIKAKIEDARRDAEFHQKVHEFLLKKIEYDALEHQEKMIRHEQYIREQRKNIEDILQLTHQKRNRFDLIRQEQQLKAKP
jgi:hypothetical protein